MRDNTAYKFTRDEQGNAYVCPVDTVEKKGRVPQDQLNDCVEADVVGRYSGGIEIVNR